MGEGGAERSEADEGAFRQAEPQGGLTQAAALSAALRRSLVIGDFFERGTVDIGQLTVDIVSLVPGDWWGGTVRILLKIFEFLQGFLL